MTFVAGMILQDGSTQVTVYDATPTIKHLRVLYHGDAGGCDWGKEASNCATDALARLVLNQLGLPVVPVEAFVSEYIRNRMTTGKMWVLRLADIEEWVVSKQVIQ